MHFSPPPYLDPGSGSILLQILLAAILGIGVFVRAQWSRIKSWFGKDVNTETEDNETDS
jgi:hypothetical protein